MRLAQPEIDAIVHAAKSNFGPSVRVILFGSRVDDRQRGGDIDVFLESCEPIPDRLRKTLRMDADLQIALGEQKIDVVFDPTMTEASVHREARKKGVVLAQDYRSPPIVVQAMPRKANGNRILFDLRAVSGLAPNSGRSAANMTEREMPANKPIGVLKKLRTLL